MPSDNFTRANESPLAGNWTTCPFDGPFILTSNHALRGASSTGAVYWNASTPGADQRSEVTVSTFGGDIGAICRIHTTGSGGEYYLAYADGILYRAQGVGVYNAMSGSLTTFTTGDIIGLQCVGTTIRMLKNGASVGTVTDSTYTTGSYGMFALANTDLVSLWTGTDLTAGSGSVIIRASNVMGGGMNDLSGGMRN